LFNHQAELLRVFLTIILTGPAKWSLIHANCGLKSQSPVDISIDSLRLDDQLDEIRLVVSNENEIENANTSVRNNGHTGNSTLNITRAQK
jgi:Eukaryotic-type carbonic anhydrase